MTQPGTYPSPVAETPPAPLPQTPGSDGKKWLRRINVAIVWVEVWIILVFVVLATLGLARHAIETGGTLKGLLTMLDERWKGALIIAVVVFYGSLKPLLLKSKLTTPFGDVNFRPLDPDPPSTFPTPIAQSTPEL